MRDSVDDLARLKMRETARRGETVPRSAAHGSTEEKLEIGEWLFDVTSPQLNRRSRSASDLTLSEYRILVLLTMNARKAVSRDQLMYIVAGHRWSPFDRTIDVHVSNLRRKVDLDPRMPSQIRTVRHVGYMFVPLSRQ